MSFALVVIKKDTWRTMQLRHDDAFGSIDNKGPGIGHQRQVAHVDFLLFYVFHRFLLGGTLLVINDQADLDAQRRRIGHTAQFAFPDIKRSIPEFIADILKCSVTGI